MTPEDLRISTPLHLGLGVFAIANGNCGGVGWSSMASRKAGTNPIVNENNHKNSGDVAQERGAGAASLGRIITGAGTGNAWRRGDNHAAQFR